MCYVSEHVLWLDLCMSYVRYLVCNEHGFQSGNVQFAAANLGASLRARVVALILQPQANQYEQTNTNTTLFPHFP